MKRYKHNLSNYHLLTCDMGKLIPIGLQEALPGDTFQMSSSAFIRVSPLAAPVMHPVHVRLHHFFVPHRLVWSGWEDFITGGPDGNDAGVIPNVNIVPAADTYGSLYDYLGIPPTNDWTATENISQLPLYGINMIWNEYYRDQDLQAERLRDDASLPAIGWGKDYFTTARPWTQKGPEVTLPLGNKAPIVGLGINPTSAAVPNVSVHETQGVRTQPHSAVSQTSGPAQQIHMEMDAAANGFPQVFADLSAAGAININDFRRAFALQRYQEARARYGSRYTEYLRYLGVTPSDARLQRPEYLGGSSARINFSEVLQTATAERPDASTFGVGDLYGHGVAGVRTGRVRRFIEEHGYIHSFMSVRPKGVYMNGIHRTFLRRKKEDFWQRELQFIGQQEIFDSEIRAGQSPIGTVFGYQDRYKEYKETPSIVAHEFRDILNFWHMARDLPLGTTLNEDFIKCVPTKRIHNVQTNDSLWVMVNNHVVARRQVTRSAASKIL
ncbi:MAG: major capsid protein [Microvirus sp.]|nr:MAG: major capsid protein [Microvirus sp.]